MARRQHETGRWEPDPRDIADAESLPDYDDVPFDRSRSPVASPVSLAPRACADNSSTAAVRFTGARTCLRPLATAFLRLPTRRAPTIPPRLLKPLNPCLVG